MLHRGKQRKTIAQLKGRDLPDYVYYRNHIRGPDRPREEWDAFSRQSKALNEIDGVASAQRCPILRWSKLGCSIPDSNPFFTGRKRVLAELQEALAAQGRAALSGLGGIGKTQIAVRYARACLPWDEEVQTGLRNSQVLLALLSPQSVRRTLDAGNPTATDSVCLDEIEYAQRACKIPIVPVQVVSCEAPFLIFRLHQINFRYWRESEATYQAGLNQICAAVTEALHSRKSPERLWWPLPQPWDFTPFILEKRKHFVGRQWLFQKIDRWRVTSPQSVLLIVGEPGIGKSAIVAALVHENPEGQVLAYQGYTRRAAIRPNKHHGPEAIAAFPHENTKIGARIRVVTGQPPGFTPTRFPKMGRTGSFRPAER